LDSFSREAATLASLDHPGIVKVLRSFRAFGTAYFVMPFVEGVTLDDLIKQRMEKGRGFSEEELLGLLTRVLDALGHLHSRGIYHRDIKPGNILITNDGVPVLIDFGAARQMVSERSMTVIESPGYTPFEQLQSRGNIGPWSDIYALAGTLYKMLTFEAPPKAMDRVRQDPVGNLASDPRLAGRYSNIFLSSIHWAFRFDERERWQSAGDWRGALANAPDILEAPTADTGFSSAATGAKPISRAAEPNPRQVQEPPPLASAQTANQSPPTKQLKHREGDVVNSIIGVVGLCLVLAGPCILLWPLFDRNKGEKAETISESKSIERQSTEVGTAKLPAEKATEVARQAVEPKAGDRMEIEIAPGVKMAFRWCPPGTFMMGSPADEAGRRRNPVSGDLEQRFLAGGDGGNARAVESRDGKQSESLHRGRPTPGRAGELGRYAGVSEEDGPSIWNGSASPYGSGVGIRLPRRNDDGLRAWGPVEWKGREYRRQLSLSRAIKQRPVS
jgi:hypothetical protein